MKLRKNRQPSRDTRRRTTTPRGREVSVFSYYGSQSRRPETASRSASNVPSPRRLEVKSTRRRLSPKFLPRHHFQLKHIPTYVACTVLAGAFLYALSLSGSPRVVVEEQPGVVQRDASVYEQQVQSLWRESVFNRTKLTAHTQQTRQAILDTYHELGDVRIQLPLVGHRATIVLVPVAPSLQIEAQNGTFYLDSEGKALADTSHVTSSSSVPTVQDNGVLTVNPGQLVLPQSQVVCIIQLFTEFDAAHVTLHSMTLSNKAVNELDIRTAGDSYYLKVQIDGSVEARQVVGTYLAMQKKFAADGVKPTEYLDLRVAEKAFYK